LIPIVRVPDRRTVSLRGDDGSVLLLIIGFMPVLFLLIAVATDAAVLFSARRSLAAQADAAAIAGVQAADLAALYTGKSLSALPVDCAKARRVVQARFDAVSTGSATGAVTVQGITCDGVSVSVRLRCSAQLPFASHFGLAPQVTVRAGAAARSPLR